MNQIISLTILGIATVLYVIKKILSIVFFPLYLAIKSRRDKFKREYIKKYSSDGLLVIDAYEFIKKNRDQI